MQWQSVTIAASLPPARLTGDEARLQKQAKSQWCRDNKKAKALGRTVERPYACLGSDERRDIWHVGESQWLASLTPEQRRLRVAVLTTWFDEQFAMRRDRFYDLFHAEATKNGDTVNASQTATERALPWPETRDFCSEDEAAQIVTMYRNCWSLWVKDRRKVLLRGGRLLHRNGVVFLPRDEEDMAQETAEPMPSASSGDGDDDGTEGDVQLAPLVSPPPLTPEELAVRAAEWSNMRERLRCAAARPFAQILADNKREEMADTATWPRAHLMSLIWNGSPADLKDLNVVLDVVPLIKDASTALETHKFREKLHTFDRLLALTTSHRLVQSLRFYPVRVFVREAIGGKVLGFIVLCGDFISLASRDQLIHWPSRDVKFLRLNSIANMLVCVPVQPFGFNFAGGKLLSRLAMSKEMTIAWRNRSGKPLAALSTTGLYGPSRQYQGLDFLPLIGETGGYGAMHIPPTLATEAVEMAARHGTPMRATRVSMHKITALGHIFKLPNLAKHGHKKAVYFGATCQQSMAYLRGETDTLDPTASLPDVSQCVTWWKRTHAIGRVKAGVKKGTFKVCEPQLYQ